MGEGSEKDVDKENIDVGEDDIGSEEEEDDELEVTNQYIFLAFFAFVAWNPFTLPDIFL